MLTPDRDVRGLGGMRPSRCWRLRSIAAAPDVLHTTRKLERCALRRRGTHVIHPTHGSLHGSAERLSVRC